MYRFVLLLCLIVSSLQLFAQTADRIVLGDRRGTHNGKLSLQSIDPSPLPTLPTLSSDVLVQQIEGMQAKISLLSEVTSKLEDGSPFQARLDKAVVKDGEMLLPEGTILHGQLKTRHARRLMRQGSVFMQFDRLLVPGEQRSAIRMSVLSADSPAVKTASEGELKPALSKKRLLIQLGGTALTAKLADDLAEAAGGTAISASTARYVGAASAAAFFLLQKGRDVKLHAGDKLIVQFGR